MLRYVNCVYLAPPSKLKGGSLVLKNSGCISVMEAEKQIFEDTASLDKALEGEQRALVGISVSATLLLGARKHPIR